MIDTLKKLPMYAAVLHPTHNIPVIVQRGVPGFIEPATGPGFSIEGFNAIHRVTPAQQSAMLAGAMFGFSYPAADPDHEAHHPKPTAAPASTVATLPKSSHPTFRELRPEDDSAIEKNLAAALAPPADRRA